VSSEEHAALLGQADLLRRAEDCERALNATSDQRKKIAFRILRDMWITLANGSSRFSAADLAKEVAAIDELQAAVIGR
jgi:hypothetical protein